MMIFSTSVRAWSPLSTTVSKLYIFTQLFLNPKPGTTSPTTLLFSSPKPMLSIFSSSLPSSGFATLSPETQSEPVQNPSCFPGTLIEISPEKLFVPPDTEISSPNQPIKMLMGSNIVVSLYATESRVNDAVFVKSSPKLEDCPTDGLPEFALVGRSNVGKSSLLNCIVRRRKLAVISKTPGKTQLINHFLINDCWYLVDLPGYGYAKAPRAVRTNWDEFTRRYFLNRSNLVSVFLLVDASIPPKGTDVEYARWLSENQIPMTLIFTKCDKRKKKKNGGRRCYDNVEDFLGWISKYFKTAPPWIMTSSVSNVGGDEILLHMAQLRNYWRRH